jgi:hypothetical protein
MLKGCGKARLKFRSITVDIKVSDYSVIADIWTKETPLIDAPKTSFARLVREAKNNLRDALMSLEMELLAYDFHVPLALLRVRESRETGNLHSREAHVPANIRYWMYETCISSKTFRTLVSSFASYGLITYGGLGSSRAWLDLPTHT